MAVSLKHGFTSAIADDPVASAAGEVLPSHWNSEHTLTLATNKLLGRGTAGTGAAEEITLGTNLSLIGTTLNATGATEIFACTTAANSLADVNTVQSIFPSANDALTVDASSTYFFEGSIRVTNGVVAHTDAFGFGGTATFTSIGYIAEGGKHAAGSINAVNQLWVTSAGMTVVTAGGTTTGAVLRVRGVMRINAGGTVIPQWQFNNAPGGTNQVEANSYIRFTKVGSDTVASSGSWA